MPPTSSDTYFFGDMVVQRLPYEGGFCGGAGAVMVASTNRTDSIITIVHRYYLNTI